jgi:hypothetical protein
MTQDVNRSSPPENPGQIDYSLVFNAAPAPYLLLAPDSPRFTIIGVNQAYLAAAAPARTDVPASRATTL